MNESKCSMGEVSILKRTVVQIFVFVLTIILFDSFAYFLVPPSYTNFAEEYRDIELVSYNLSLQPDSLLAQPPPPKWAKWYPRSYFEAEETLGFDISPGVNMTAKFWEGDFQIFANDLGCFDKNTLYDFQKAEEHVYFAGDSFTWGYARYEKKFPTVWEQRTNKLTAKCGVTNTGQLHQFEKFKRITTRIGKFPKIVFVGFSPNDPADDLTHPHTTVISGYQVDTAYFKGGSIVRPSIEDLRNAVDSSTREYAYTDKKKTSAWLRLKTYLKVYSLSSNILNGLIRHLGPSSQLAPTRNSPAIDFGEHISNAFTFDDVKNHYTRDPRADLNKSAIKNWSEHARDNGYKLVFLLIPPKESFDDVDYFRQVREWLDFCGVDYIDFALIFRNRGYKVYDVYWKTDGHFNENGNQIVGEELSRSFISRYGTISSPKK